ncbi:MAG TPA: hypothetical protein VHV30_09510 [Polyangiaceae bacterium]|jgi:hypothetical protein|nr:hypothetical protein [Polyangiaceae bacterium]
MTRVMTGPLVAVLALGCMAATLGCDEKKSSESAPSLDASAASDKYATADPKLEKALQAVASAMPPNDNGPPPDGIFAPGVADKRHPKGAPTTVEVLSDGAEPRVTLNDAAPDAVRVSSYGPAALELAVQLGPRQAFPTVDFSLLFGPAKKDDGGNDWLVAEAKKTALAQDQLGDMQPGTDQVVATLQGSQLRIKVGADGCESDLQVIPGKGTPASLSRLSQAAAELLVFSTVPLPNKPVGAGAQWIAESRMTLSEMEVIAYRAIKVKSIEGNRLHLSLDVKAYATSPDITMPEVPKGATLQQVDVQGQGEMELVRGEILARKSQVQQRVVMVFSAPPGTQPPGADPGQPPPKGPATLTGQTMSQATFVRGEDLRALKSH